MWLVDAGMRVVALCRYANIPHVPPQTSCWRGQGNTLTWLPSFFFCERVSKLILCLPVHVLDFRHEKTKAKSIENIGAARRDVWAQQAGGGERAGWHHQERAG